MKAHEVIDQIKAPGLSLSNGPGLSLSNGMPPEEQAKVIDFIEEVKAAQRVRFADEASFASAAAWVFQEHAELMRKLSQ